MPELVGFVGSASKDRSLNFDAQRCVNMFPQISASGTSKSPAKLVSCPGLEIFADFRTTINRGVRGAIVFNSSSVFIVSGTKVLRMNQNGAITDIGTIPSLDTPVSMATNGINVMFVTGAEGYIIDPATNTVTKIVNVSFQGADAVAFITGSYVFNEPNSARWWAMNPYAVTINPLWFATAEGSPDALVTLAVVNQEVWLFGTETTEIWTNVGQAGFPFAQVTGAFIEQGCAAKNSVAKLDESLFWLSANAVGQCEVYRSSGMNATKISNHSIEQEFSSYATVDDAVAYGYQQDGHHFYVISFPTQNVTWVYDTVTLAWHQRAYLEQRDGQLSRHRSNCHIFFQRKNLVGDWDFGIIYNMSPMIYSDNGNPLLRIRSSPHVSDQDIRMGHANIEFDIETGIGLEDGQGSDPQIMLRWSDDNGHTYYGQRQMSVGKIGNYSQRVRFTRLGQARDRVYELSYSEPTKFTVFGATINAT